MKPFKNRKIEYDKPILAYRKLYKNSTKVLYSLKQNGLVVAHSDVFTLYNCKTIINKGGQKRCRETGVRNVHAFIWGYLPENMWEFSDYYYKVHYNPMVDDNFWVSSIDGHKEGEKIPFGKCLFTTFTPTGVYV